MQNTTSLCDRCRSAGHCRLKKFVMLTKIDLKNAELRRAVRNSGYEIFEHNGVKGAAVVPFLEEKYSRIHEALENGETVAEIVNGAWQPQYLNTELMGPPEKIFYKARRERWKESLRSWIRRTYGQRVPDQVIPMMPDRPKLFLLTGSLIGSLLPEQSKTWPRYWEKETKESLGMPSPTNDNRRRLTD